MSHSKGQQFAIVFKVPGQVPGQILEQIFWNLAGSYVKGREETKSERSARPTGQHQWRTCTFRLPSIGRSHTGRPLSRYESSRFDWERSRTLPVRLDSTLKYRHSDWHLEFRLTIRQRRRACRVRARSSGVGHLKNWESQFEIGFTRLH